MVNTLHQRTEKPVAIEIGIPAGERPEEILKDSVDSSTGCHMLGNDSAQRTGATGIQDGSETSSPVSLERDG